jgi:hypothetical protein
MTVKERDEGNEVERGVDVEDYVALHLIWSFLFKCIFLDFDAALDC